MAIEIKFDNEKYLVGKTSYSYKCSWTCPSAETVNKNGTYGPGKNEKNIYVGGKKFYLTKQNFIHWQQIDENLSENKIIVNIPFPETQNGSSSYSDDKMEYSNIIPDNEKIISWSLVFQVIQYYVTETGVWGTPQRISSGTAKWWNVTGSQPDFNQTDDKTYKLETKWTSTITQTGKVQGLYHPWTGELLGYEYEMQRSYEIYQTVVQPKISEEEEYDKGQYTIIFYPRQVDFSFNNCQLKADGTHQKWLIEKGINSLITNITDFQKYARQWKSWKEQKKVSSPGGWVDTKNRIGAVQVNALYDYVEITTQDTHRFSPGDKVTMALFNDLASKINS